MMTVEVARDRGWWIAHLTYAGQTYHTQGHTLRELREMIDATSYEDPQSAQRKCFVIFAPNRR